MIKTKWFQKVTGGFFVFLNLVLSSNLAAQTGPIPPRDLSATPTAEFAATADDLYYKVDSTSLAGIAAPAFRASKKMCESYNSGKHCHQIVALAFKSAPRLAMQVRTVSFVKLMGTPLDAMAN